jgi:hypothetical protein
VYLIPDKQLCSPAHSRDLAWFANPGGVVLSHPSRELHNTFPTRSATLAPLSLSEHGHLPPGPWPTTRSTSSPGPPEADLRALPSRSPVRGTRLAGSQDKYLRTIRPRHRRQAIPPSLTPGSAASPIPQQHLLRSSSPSRRHVGVQSQRLGNESPPRPHLRRGRGFNIGLRVSHAASTRPSPGPISATTALNITPHHDGPLTTDARWGGRYLQHH